jgi:DNA-binding transcriptional LysR family regulator
MTFKQLEALYWIAQLGGFAQAANQLHTSQSAVSKRVHELELLFDTALFDRSQRTARLTEKGEEMFVLAKKLLTQRDAAVEQFGKPGVVERRIRIGVTELTAMTWLPRLVGLIQQHYPKVILEPDVDDSLQLRDKLLADELDLVIVPDTFADSRLPNKVIGQVRSAWMCKPGVVPATATTGTVRLHELARHRMLVQGNNSGTGRAYDAWMKEQGVQPTNVIVVSNLVALTGPHRVGAGRELPAAPVPGAAGGGGHARGDRRDAGPAGGALRGHAQGRASQRPDVVDRDAGAGVLRLHADVPGAGRGRCGAEAIAVS